MATNDLKVALVLSVKDALSKPLIGIRKHIDDFAKDVTSLGRTADTHFTGMTKAIGTIGNIGVRAFTAVARGLQNVVGRMAEGIKWAGLFGAGLTVAFGKSAADAALQMEAHLAKLTTALKDADKAAAMLEWAKAFAAKTPFDVSEVVDATVRLELYGLSAKKWLPLVGDMAGAMSRRVTDAVEAVADAITGGGLERMKEFGINSQILLAAGANEKMMHGMPMGMLSYRSAEDFAKLKEAIEKIINTRFGSGMERMSKTAVGALSNFKDSIFAFRVAVGQALMPALMKAIPIVKAFLESLTAGGGAENIGQSLGKMVTTAVSYFSQLVNWLQANKQAVGEWFQYFVDYGKYLVAWVYKNIPDILETFVSVFAGIAKAVLVTEMTFIGFKTGLLVVADVIAAAFTGVAAIVAAALGTIIELSYQTLRIMNALSFGKLKTELGQVKAMRDAVWSFTERAANAPAQLWKKAKQEAGAGRARNTEIKEQAQGIMGMEANARAWSAGVRQRWQNVPTPVTPNAPQTSWTSWQNARPIVIENKLLLDGKVVAENQRMIDLARNQARQIAEQEARQQRYALAQ